MSNGEQNEMKIEIIEEKVIFNEYFEVKRASLRHQRFDGTLTPEITRYCYEKNDAVAGLIYHQEKDTLLFVKQFRYPSFRHGRPWLTEIVAGGVDIGETAEQAMIREVKEEVGYHPNHIEWLHQMYVSPGSFSERIDLFYLEVSEEDRIDAGGGLLDEDEDLELVWIPTKDAEKWMYEEIVDAKTLIALYNFFHKKLNKKRTTSLNIDKST